LLAHGRWSSPGTPASSTTKTGRHDIAEILLKMALKHQKPNQIIIYIMPPDFVVIVGLSLAPDFVTIFGLSLTPDFVVIIGLSLAPDFVTIFGLRLTTDFIAIVGLSLTPDFVAIVDLSLASDFSLDYRFCYHI
jgi:hypothetical protein